jgi:hypothetical protein
MREILHFEREESRPEAAEVLEDQGLPPAESLAPRLRGLLDEALATYAPLAEPRAVWEDVTHEGFARVVRAFERPGDQMVVAHVYPRADALRLYVATVGESVGARIRELFREEELPRAWMLDAVASTAADRLAELLARRLEDDLTRGSRPEARVLPYSPGYCGWPTRGQAALFAALRPEEIGVTLNDSCLMSPLKSVSGVLVAGLPDVHRFRPDFPFCHECRSRECGPRMASVLRTASPLR